MLEINSTGPPHLLGLEHGTQAREHISRSLTFYQKLFQKNCSLSWDKVKSFALKYHPYLVQNWPQYVEEMEGVAKGAEVTYADVLALNVRTEIAFGAFSDGCTALSWKGERTSVLGQNWDWNPDQAENLVCLRITKDDGLGIQMITEAGIIGKIGINSLGVGCTLNAIKAKGVSYEKLPCHLALRTVIESASRAAAISKLEKAGVASACHILVADVTGGTGLECSSEDVVRLEMSREGIVTHTNHYLLEHDKKVVEAEDWLPDTRFRLRRIGELLNVVKEEEPSPEVAEKFLKDEMEENGAAICRSGGLGLSTLFSIVMDLGSKRAKVLMGRPAKPTETLNLIFECSQR